jgi:cytochrome c oxidase subunit IV
MMFLPPEQVSSIRTYAIVFVLLLVLATLTTAVSYIDLGVFNIVIAMLIAATKMLLVALFFMHLKYAVGLTRIVSIAGLFWLALLVAFSMADVFTRHWTPQGRPW